jgi:hypothetical protein
VVQAARCKIGKWPFLRLFIYSLGRAPIPGGFEEKNILPLISGCDVYLDGGLGELKGRDEDQDGPDRPLAHPQRLLEPGQG